MTEDRIMTAAEADRADALAALEAHRRECHVPGECLEGQSLIRHVGRTEKQIALLSAPGETEEMF